MPKTATQEVDLYRPTIRCDLAFRDYIETLYQSTNLDRNQIIRLMMFSAPFSGAFRSQIEKHLVGNNNDCPQPSWSQNESELWKEQYVANRITAGA